MPLMPGYKLILPLYNTLNTAIMIVDNEVITSKQVIAVLKESVKQMQDNTIVSKQ